MTLRWISTTQKYENYQKNLFVCTKNRQIKYLNIYTILKDHDERFTSGSTYTYHESILYK